MENLKLNVDGMSCGHCVQSIKKGLLENKGITDVNVSLQEKTVTVTYSSAVVTALEIKQSIEEIGYDVD